MNGVHDMGGMHGMGPVEAEVDEPVFHADWERRAFALTLAGGAFGRWNLDMSRFTREQMPPAAYLAASYYERWLWGLERLLERSGLLAPGELDARVAAAGPADRLAAEAAPPRAAPAGVRVLRAGEVLAALKARGGALRSSDAPARFRPGERVRARMMNPVGHTRLPRYARGRVGVIERDHGVWVFPDSHAAGAGEAPQRLYGVRFSAQELWGPEADGRDSVVLDLWDDYLEAA